MGRPRPRGYPGRRGRRTARSHSSHRRAAVRVLEQAARVSLARPARCVESELLALAEMLGRHGDGRAAGAQSRDETEVSVARTCMQLESRVAVVDAKLVKL